MAQRLVISCVLLERKRVSPKPIFQMYIFGTEVDDNSNNQVEYLDTEAKMLVRMGPSSRPPGTMNRLEECAVAWNDTQIVHIQPKGHLDIFNIELG